MPFHWGICCVMFLTVVVFLLHCAGHFRKMDLNGCLQFSVSMMLFVNFAVKKGKLKPAWEPEIEPSRKVYLFYAHAHVHVYVWSCFRISGPFYLISLQFLNVSFQDYLKYRKSCFCTPFMDVFLHRWSSSPGRNMMHHISWTLAIDLENELSRRRWGF